MKKNIQKMIFPLCLAVSALSMVSLLTSCGKDEQTDEEDLPVIADITTTAETTTEEITSSLTEVQTTTETTTIFINVPTGTQAEIIVPPVTEYTEPSEEIYIETTDTQLTAGISANEPVTYTVTTSISSYVGNSLTASPNSEFYQEKIYVAGDSIAFGFNLYGLIPDGHNIATESLSMWNLDYFTFPTGMGLVDTIAYYQPSLLYMSLGMNDVNASTAEQFAERYQNTIKQIRERVPDINIAVAGITPVTIESGFVDNQVIIEFNNALENMVRSLNTTHVYYFDTFSILADSTDSLRTECTGGDGIHLTTQCYYDIFNNLFTFLDKTNVKKQIEQAEVSKGYVASAN
ncbi:MAG: hypothetical protein K2J08_13355 [Ruminococcus sp.]|nr:hypothetical protein [Ruminococcus sp.]